MPFRLYNAFATFQRATDRIFHDSNRIFVIPYLDDIIVFSESRVEPQEQLETVLKHPKIVALY